MKGSLRPVLIAFALLVLLLLTASCTALPEGGKTSRWDRPVDQVAATFDRALAAYEKGDRETATQLAKDAYFEVFESSGMETAVRLGISTRRNSELEAGFSDVRRLIRQGAKPAEVRQATTGLVSMLRDDAARLGGGGQGGGATDFLASFLIIVREGFEAILILGAIVAYLVKSGNGAKVRTIYQSALLAVLASIATAVVVRYVLKIGGAGQELLEGATMLLAMAVLFSVSFWLLGKAQADQWQRYIQSKLERSLSTGSTMALWSAAFLAVYREGAETVLFYQALVSGSAGDSVGAIGLGFGAGALVLAAIFVAVRWGSIRIPIKPFFVGTGAFLYYMAFVFAGQGIKELQEAGILETSRAAGLPTVDLLGIHPSWEGLALQSALVVTAAVGLAYQLLHKPRSAATGGRTAT